MDRLPGSVRIGCAADNQRLKATSVPENPAMWSFHALYESSVCLSPNDSRLHETLQKPTLSGYDPAHSQWLSSTLHADLAKSVTTAEITIPQLAVINTRHTTSTIPCPGLDCRGSTRQLEADCRERPRSIMGSCLQRRRWTRELKPPVTLLAYGI